MLLDEAEHAVEYRDHDDRGELEPVPEGEREAGGEQQDVDEQRRELPQ